MTKYTVRRVCMAFVTLLLVACITFFLMNAIPGNPWLSEKTPSEATIQALNAKYGLDQPKYIQLGKYLKNLAQGDFGTSIKMQKNRPVIEIIKEMFPVSAKVGSLGGQLSACAVYHRYLHAGICSGNLTVTYTLWRYRRSESISGTF